MNSVLANNAESFTPDKDINETTPDGRTIQIAVKGVPMPISEAKRMGLIDSDKTATSSKATNNKESVAELKKAQSELKAMETKLEKANKKIEDLEKDLTDAKEKAKKPAESKPAAPSENK